MGHTLSSVLLLFLTTAVFREGLAEAQKLNATLRAANTTIPLGGHTLLTCSVDYDDPAGWKYKWFRGTKDSSEEIFMRNDTLGPNTTISVAKGGNYWCRAGRGDSMNFTEDSNFVTIYKLVPFRAVVTLEPIWTEIFRGEMKTIRCDIQRGEGTEWEYDWMTPTLRTTTTSNEYKIRNAVASHGGEYRCKGRHRGDLYSSTEWSETITLTFHPKARAKISADKKDIPAGGDVTLTCSVNPPSPGWKYSWFRGERNPTPLNPQDAVFLSSQQISVSRGGPYWCKAGRGSPVYSTENTDYIRLNKLVNDKAVLTLQPQWPIIYKDETIILTCEIKDGGNTIWEYEWATGSSNRPQKQREIIFKARQSDSGKYWCRGKSTEKQEDVTDWSEYVTVSVYNYIPKPNLAVSTSWLNSGDSVTLSCEIADKNAGWRFYWYKAVPKLSDKTYNYELLPGDSRGTAHDSYMVHGQTHTAGYVCQARRGELFYYTQYSDLQFVWSGDSPSVALKVSSNRVQHFTSDSITLSCEGASDEWRVKSFKKMDTSSDNSACLKLRRATCQIPRFQEGNTVYWCESGSGEFSNAVNISTTNKQLILVSPVHPVTEGESFTLGCKLKTGGLDSTVFFYHNDKIIGNDTEGQLRISAASLSHAGLYKCKCGKRESLQSWVAVKAAGSSSLLLGLVGLLFAVIVVILLLLLFYYLKFKDPYCYQMTQCLSTNQGTAENQITNQDVTPQQVYSTLIHGDVSVYESIGPNTTDEIDHEYVNETHPPIQLQALNKCSTHGLPMESPKIM